MSQWKTIAKYEIIRKTSRFRKHRGHYLIFFFTIAFFWALDLCPILLNNLILKNTKDLIGTHEGLIIQLFEYSIMTIFLLTMIYPLYNLYRKTEIGQKVILLETPVKSSDIFLGEFMGKLFFYFLAFLIIGPFITSFLLLIKPLNIFDYFLIYINLFGLLSLSLLIGTIMASLIENKVIKNEITLDLGKFSSLLFIILTMALFYFLRFFFNFFFINPQFKNFLIFLPPFWYSNNILYIVYPFYITSSHILFIMLNIILSIIVPILIFYLGYKYANHLYSLNFQIEKRINTIKNEKYYNKILKKLILPKWRNIVTIQFKEFFRKKENLAKLLFIILLPLIMGLYISSAFNDPDPTWKFNIPNFPIFIIMLLSWMIGILFGILMGINIFIGSKEILFVYRKSPRGAKTLIFSYLYMMFYIILLYGLFFAPIFSFLFHLNFIQGSILFLCLISYSGVILLQAVGIQCFKPLFNEQGKNAYLISYSILGLQVISLFIIMYIFIPHIPNSLNNSEGLNFILFSHLMLSIVFSLVIFYFGIRHLKKIE